MKTHGPNEIKNWIERTTGRIDMNTHLYSNSETSGYKKNHDTYEIDAHIYTHIQIYIKSVYIQNQTSTYCLTAQQ